MATRDRQLLWNKCTCLSYVPATKLVGMWPLSRTRRTWTSIVGSWIYIVLQHHHVTTFCDDLTYLPTLTMPSLEPDHASYGCNAAEASWYHAPFPLSLFFPQPPMCHCDFSLPFRQSLRASSQSLQSSPHLSITKPQLLARIMFSTPLSCRIIAANRSVLGSLGKNLEE